jgi:ankyrin repeat protein
MVLAPKILARLSTIAPPSNDQSYVSIPEGFLKNDFTLGHSECSQNVPRKMKGLYLSVFFGAYKAANTLIIRGQRLDLKNSYSRTPLSYAAMNRHEAVVKLLLEKGAELKTKDNYD